MEHSRARTHTHTHTVAATRVAPDGFCRRGESCASLPHRLYPTPPRPTPHLTTLLPAATALRHRDGHATHTRHTTATKRAPSESFVSTDAPWRRSSAAVSTCPRAAARSIAVNPKVFRVSTRGLAATFGTIRKPPPSVGPRVVLINAAPLPPLGGGAEADGPDGPDGMVDGTVDGTVGGTVEGLLVARSRRSTTAV